jgi:hypothetical protein
VESLPCLTKDGSYPDAELGASGLWDLGSILSGFEPRLEMLLSPGGPLVRQASLPGGWLCVYCQQWGLSWLAIPLGGDRCGSGELSFISALVTGSRPTQIPAWIYSVLCFLSPPSSWVHHNTGETPGTGVAWSLSEFCSSRDILSLYFIIINEMFIVNSKT